MLPHNRLESPTERGNIRLLRRHVHVGVQDAPSMEDEQKNGGFARKLSLRRAWRVRAVCVQRVHLPPLQDAAGAPLAGHSLQKRRGEYTVIFTKEKEIISSNTLLVVLVLN